MADFNDVKSHLSTISNSAQAINDDLEKAEKGVKKARVRIRKELLTMARACKECRKDLAELNRTDLK